MFFAGKKDRGIELAARTILIVTGASFFVFALAFYPLKGPV